MRGPIAGWGHGTALGLTAMIWPKLLNGICRTGPAATRAANLCGLLDSDPFWLCLRMLANRDLQNAVAPGGTYVLGICSIGQDAATVEPAV